MSDGKKCSLAELRLTLDAALAEPPGKQLEQILRELSNDSRLGAQKLFASGLRRREAAAAETLRLKRFFRHSRDLRNQGARNIAGIDEVGVGPLAGPVVAAAVILPATTSLPGLNDSKKLSAQARVRLDLCIREQAIEVQVAELWPEEIDRLNIYHAALEAMRQSVLNCVQKPDHLLVDARTIPNLTIPQTALVHGDAEEGVIAAASIVAKVHRDGIMAKLAQQYPGYGFERHMGYPTEQHRGALKKLGVTPVHRRSFRPVAECLSQS